jgi:hypothetical protein
MFVQVFRPEVRDDDRGPPVRKKNKKQRKGKKEEERWCSRAGFLALRTRARSAAGWAGFGRVWSAALFFSFFSSLTVLKTVLVLGLQVANKKIRKKS